MASLMIAPVDDECGILPPLESRGLLDNVHHVWEKTSLFRPLPLALLASLQVLLGDPDSYWIIFRCLNICLLLASLACLLGFLQRLGCRSHERLILFSVTFLFGGAAVIVATWFANTYDASALLCISLGLLLISHKRPWTAGVAIGLAFFCKESAALVLPFLGYLLLFRNEQRRTSALATGTACLFALIYWLLRSQVTVLGSAADVHGFELDRLAPTLIGLIQTFWSQTVASPLRWLACLSFGLSLLLVRRWLSAAALAAIWLGSTVVYMGMITPRDFPMIHQATYSGRLFLIPVTMAALILAMNGRRAALWIVLVPGLIGGYEVYHRHRLQQQVYRQAYDLAADSVEKPLVVHSATPGNFYSPRLGIRIGNFPDADWELNRDEGRLVARRSPANGIPVRGVLVVRMLREQLSPVARRRGGEVEEIKARGANLRIRGWLPFADQERHQKVYVVVGQRPKGTKIATEERHDLGRKQALHCGFEIVARFRDPEIAERAASDFCLLAESASTPLTLLSSDNPACERLLDGDDRPRFERSGTGTGTGMGL
jgi:hypothetical protein